MYLIANFVTLSNSKSKTVSKPDAYVQCSTSVLPLKIQNYLRALLATTNAWLAKQSTNAWHVTVCTWTHSEFFSLKNHSACVGRGIMMMVKTTSSASSVMRAVWRAEVQVCLNVRYVPKEGREELRGIVFVTITLRIKMEHVCANRRISILETCVLHSWEKTGVHKTRFKFPSMEQIDANASQTICCFGRYAFYASRTKKLITRLVGAFARRGFTVTRSKVFV